MEAMTTSTEVIVEALGLVGRIMISLSLVPQVFKTFRTKDASSISVVYQVIYIIGCTLINLYAFYTNMWVIYVPHVGAEFGDALAESQCKQAFHDVARMPSYKYRCRVRIYRYYS
jgi:uncharacterized protein with PQ loop repeat